VGKPYNSMDKPYNSNRPAIGCLSKSTAGWVWPPFFQSVFGLASSDFLLLAGPFFFRRARQRGGASFRDELPIARNQDRTGIAISLLQVCDMPGADL
jgi:hypothetical protein